MPQVGHCTGPTRSSSVVDILSTMLASRSAIENLGGVGTLTRPRSSAQARQRCTSVIRLSWTFVKCSWAGFLWQFWHCIGVRASLRRDRTPVPSGLFAPGCPSCVQSYHAVREGGQPFIVGRNQHGRSEERRVGKVGRLGR